MNRERLELTSQEFLRNPFPTLARLRERGPLIPAKLPFVGNAWVGTTYEAATRILRDRDLFVADPKHAGRRHYAGLQWWMPRTILALANNMLGKDEPDHRRLRALVEGAFMRQSIDELRPRIATLVDRQLDHVERQASPSGGLVDFVEHFARPFPLAVISELMGFPDADRPKFLQWAANLTSVTSPLGILKVLRGLFGLTRYFERQFEICRREPRPGMLSALVQAEQDGDRLSRQELLASTFLLLLAGHETTVHLLSGGIFTLLQHSTQRELLTADWSLGHGAVAEILRFYAPVQMTKPRYVSQNVDLFGQSLRRGEVCMPLLAAANADPAQFPEPERFDIRRDPNNHLTFGTGMHVCLGMKLASAEAEIAFEKLLTRFGHLALAVPEAELRWRERIGIRALIRLPLRLAPG